MDFEDLQFSDVVLFALVPVAIFFVLAIHEFGHYLAARLCRVPIDEVVIGVGKEIWSRGTRGNTRISLRLFPFWAHVLVAGFNSSQLPRWKKVLIISAGPAVNLILPFFLIFAFFCAAGQPSTPSVLTGVEIGGPADEAGLKPGDEIISVNGIPVRRYADVKKLAYDRVENSTLGVRRGDDVLDIEIKPELYSFTDVDGIPRNHPRLGVIWQHKAMGLKIVHGFNGIDTKGQKDRARRLIQENFGREVIVGLDSNDGKLHQYRVFLNAESNLDIGNKGQKDYKLVFLGRTRDDIYMKMDTLENFKAAVAMNSDLIQKVAGLPLQLLPIDPYILTPDYFVDEKATWLLNKTYKLIYITCLGSILVAFINLLPLPRLDGSLLVLYMVESVSGKKLEYRHHGYIMALAFLVLYLCIFFSNLDNVPVYIDSRLKKLQEFMNSED